MQQAQLDFDRPVKPIDPNIDHRDVPRVSRQCGMILDLLRQRPATNLELSEIALKYTSRLSDLRAAGYVIRCTRREGGLTVYTLGASQ